MNESNHPSAKTADSKFSAKLFAELQGLELLTTELTHRYGGSMMDLLIREVEKAIEHDLIEEQFSENLRSLGFATFTFAKNVLVLCNPQYPSYSAVEIRQES
jgi:hypothetical protein